MNEGKILAEIKKILKKPATFADGETPKLREIERVMREWEKGNDPKRRRKGNTS